jgi:hypothetical protein
MAMGSARSLYPDLVTQATSGANPSMWFFSLAKAFSVTNIGKYEF